MAKSTQHPKPLRPDLQSPLTALKETNLQVSGHKLVHAATHSSRLAIGAPPAAAAAHLSNSKVARLRSGLARF